MGTTLENGVYLPSEGERNCYAGLKTNWEILDQKVADVTALQQAVAGALHREIVESLPTTDIDPNTIYMVLSGTSATENVYNEYMYVNNAWELIGTSATDLTNYYTKAEVDGKLLLKANASDLTSHTGDTTIHVTASDKNRWNNQTYVFRYSSTALVASSTNSNALLDNTDNLKVGDKVIDSSGVLFSITAIDTQNSTFTIGTALIDLAQDSDVVHTSGNETVGGEKTFTSSIKGYNSDSTQNTVSIDLRTSKVSRGSTSDGVDTFGFGFRDKNNSALASISCVKRSTGGISEYHTVNTTDSSNNVLSESYSFNLSKDGNSTFRPETNDKTLLGTSTNNWKGVYATNYYYGSNNVEFSTKFVTTDTDQTVDGKKQLNAYLTLNGSQMNNEFSNNARTCAYLTANRDTVGKSGVFVSKFRQNRAQGSMSGNDVVQVTFDVLENEVRTNRLWYLNWLDWNNDVPETVEIRSMCNKVDYKLTHINGLNPSSLSLPDLSNGIDISSYITMGNTDNNYTPPANGWIWIRLIGNGAGIIQGDFGVNANYVSDNLTQEKWVESCLLVTKDVQATIRCRSITGIVGAKFYPCQGNV